MVYRKTACGISEHLGFRKVSPEQCNALQINATKKEFEIDNRAFELIPLHLEMAYTSLKRVANDFARAVRLVLSPDLGVRLVEETKHSRTFAILIG